MILVKDVELSYEIDMVNFILKYIEIEKVDYIENFFFVLIFDEV